MNNWLIIIGMGIITYAIRLSFILLMDYLTIPEVMRRGLQYVPVAVLSAIIVPALLRPSGTLDLSLGNERLLAGAVAIAVAWFSKNVVLTIVAGMVALWLIQWLT